jgi:hypothetical protein
MALRANGPMHWQNAPVAIREWRYPPRAKRRPSEGTKHVFNSYKYQFNGGLADAQRHQP